MIGSIAEVLLKKKDYRDQVEQMLTAYVFPEFTSPHGHMRARAFWVLQMFSEVEFKNLQVLHQIIQHAAHALLYDTDTPVKVESAIVLQVYLSSQDGKPHDVVKNALLTLEKGNVQEITMELLRLIGQTQIDDLNSAMQTFVGTFSEHLAPIVVKICEHLEQMFKELVNGPESNDDSEETANGFLGTIEKLLAVFEENAEVAAGLQPYVVSVIRLILEHQRTCEYSSFWLDLNLAKTIN